jgi:hypothetical protein
MDQPLPHEDRWHCVFTTDKSRGTATLVRRRGYISAEDTHWINHSLSCRVGIYDMYLKPPPSYDWIGSVSDQVCLKV